MHTSNVLRGMNRRPAAVRQAGLALVTSAAAVLLLACETDRAPLSPVTKSDAAADAKGQGARSPNPSGQLGTVSTRGGIGGGNAFFQSLGTNGRTCASCHVQASGFGLSAQAAQAVFAASGGTDPLFAPVDGANCPSVTAADGAAGHSLLLNYGLIRVAMQPPAGTQFTIQVVHDPYGCALVPSPPPGGQPTVSVYRRPLPTSNLRFLSAVMWDGRETVQPLTNAASLDANLRADLAHQAMDATMGHAQAAVSPTPAQLNAIVDFELGLYSAQQVDNAAGELHAQQAKGGPDMLTGARYHPGVNDPLGADPSGGKFDPNAFSIYTPWAKVHNNGRWGEARASIARGQAVFNNHPLTMTNVPGLNDGLGAPTIAGTCSTCHNTPNVGNHSTPLPLDIGVSRSATYESNPQVLAALAPLSAPDLPVYQVTCTAGPLAGRMVYTSDPGRALLTGQCSDIGRLKGPVLRGLAARAPYFHNGAAASVDEVVEFYNQRFQMELTDQERTDLVAFLRSL
jgi:cytochrome c peroxidase